MDFQFHSAALRGLREQLTMTDLPEAAAPPAKTNNQRHLHRAADAVQVSAISDQPLPFPLPVMVESLLFVASEPVPIMQLAEALNVKLAEVEQALAELNAEIVMRGVRVQRKGDKVQLTTQPECAPYVEKFLDLDLTTRLSKPALETLAIIAYQQPVTRAQIEHVRGVNCDAVLATLLNRGLIEELGRLETAGRPIQYGTTFAFLQHFGLRSLEDMPSLQPEEAVALEALAGQGRIIAVDLTAPSKQAATETVSAAAAPEPEQPPAPVEAQLSLIGDEAPQTEHADIAAEQEVVMATHEAIIAEARGIDRGDGEPVAVDPAPDQVDAAVEPQSAEESALDENAAN
jgi:segregation and condensation protein B